MYVESNLVARPRNIYAFSTNLTLWYDVNGPERFCGDVKSSAILRGAEDCYHLSTHWTVG